MRSVTSFVLLILLSDIVNANVRSVQPQRRRQRFAVSACNSTLTYDRVLLKRLTLLSKYVFTGKVFGVHKDFNGTRVYKVNIRRVLKGDLNDIGVVVKFGTPKSLRFSDATVFVESAEAMCQPLRVRTYGIFLTEKHDQNSMWLSLVVEPLVLTLRSIDIIEAAVKGKYSFGSLAPFVI